MGGGLTSAVLVLLLFLVLAVSMGTASAQPVIQQEPRNNPLVIGAGSVFGHSGECVWTATDMTIPGRGFPFQFSRTYRSGSSYNGPLGYGWTHGYDQRLTGTFPGNMTFYDGTGRKDVYVWDGVKYVSPAGFYDKLVYLGAGGVGPDQFTITGRYGTVRKFAQRGLSGVRTTSSSRSRTAMTTP